MSNQAKTRTHSSVKIGLLTYVIAMFFIINNN